MRRWMAATPAHPPSPTTTASMRSKTTQRSMLKSYFTSSPVPSPPRPTA
ncbi:hypothetical protein ACFFX0_27970 [Citricoccus parietis]|uniref:Uncharacterized protein n=1 Tax=Citricoccus parietis TaxID=592307 RepID=A0ABV5G796_9MICC